MNASFWEVAQTSAAAIGTLMSVRSKIDVDRSLEAVTRSRFNGNRRVIAEKNVRTETILLGAQFVLLVAGATTMALAPPPYIPGLPIDYLRTMAARAIAMTVISVLLLYLSYKNWVVMAPLHAARKTDTTETVPLSVAHKAEIVAEGAQQVADNAQAVAVDVRAAANGDSNAGSDGIG